MSSGTGGTPSQRNNRMMWRTPFGISSNSVLPSASRTAQESAVPAIRKCASCGPRAPGDSCGHATHSTRSARQILLIGGEKTGDGRWYETPA
jgi:hypothetical protein